MPKGYLNKTGLPINNGFKNGKSPWNKGKSKTGNLTTGKKRYNWVEGGNKYNSIHRWVQRWKIKPDHCEMCGVVGKKYQWANIDHKYRRVLEDYILMCVPCHKKYDKENNGSVFGRPKKKYN